MEYLNYLRKLKTIENNDFQKNITDEKIISEAEKILDLKFPKSYRLFLQELGCGGIEWLEIYGIPQNKLNLCSIPNAIWLTLDERKCSNINKNLVLIAQSDEYFYAINCSNSDNDLENPIIDYNPSKKIEECEIIAKTFEEFLINSVNEVCSSSH